MGICLQTRCRCFHASRLLLRTVVDYIRLLLVCSFVGNNKIMCESGLYSLYTNTNAVVLFLNLALSRFPTGTWIIVVVYDRGALIRLFRADTDH